MFPDLGGLAKLAIVGLITLCVLFVVALIGIPIGLWWLFQHVTILIH